MTINPGRLFIWVFMASAAVAFAQSEDARSQETYNDTILTTSLDEVVLTATRTERQLSSLPLPVTLISKTRIQQSGTIRLNEILNEQTGIITVADESGFEGVQIQGIASDYVLILMDGVPLVGRQAGNFDLSRLTVGNVKQIEVVKGPSSSLYGSEALGGVINIITEKPLTEDVSGNASYRIGSFNQQDVNIDIKQRVGKFRYGLFANRFSSDGYDLNPEEEGQTVNPFENYTLNSRLYFDLNDHLSLFGSARYYDQVQEAGFSLNGTSFEGDSQEQEWNAHFRADHKWNERFTAEYEFYFTNYQATELLFDPINNDVLSDSDFDQTLTRPEIRGTYSLEKAGKITIGFGYQFDRLDRTFFDEQVQFESQYVYGQWDVSPLERLNIIAGVRYDNHSEYSDQLSPKLAMRFELSDAISLKASGGYGFKAPDFRQLYFDFTNSSVGYTVLGYNVAVAKLHELDEQGQVSDIVVPFSELDEPLNAESSVGLNLGMSVRKGKLSGEFNLFRNDFQNLIDTRIIARKTNGQNIFSYVNFEEIYTTGIEVNTDYKINANLSLAAGYQLLYAYDKQDREAVGNGEVFARDPSTNRTVLLEQADYFGLINRSRHNANLKVYYTHPEWGFDLNARVLYRSKYALFDTNGNGLIDTYDTSFVDGFATVNVAATKSVFKDLDLQVGANNLFDFRDSNIPSQPGIQLFTRLNYQF